MVSLVAVMSDKDFSNIMNYMYRISNVSVLSKVLEDISLSNIHKS